MPELPLVTIVTPSFNQGQFLEQTIQSVLGQDYPRLEYIVMDGGSSDNSREILQRYAERLAYWESQPDRGQAEAINKGLRRAQGDILGWLNSDDVLLPGVVRRTVEVFARHPEVDVIYGHLERIDADGRVVPTPLLPKDQVTFGKERVIGECVVNQPGSFWRRSVMEKAGMLDDSLQYVMDYEYWIRLALAGANFLRLPQTAARFRLSSGSKTVGQTARMSLEQWQVLEHLLARPNLAEQLGLPAVRVQKQARAVRAHIALHIFYGYFKQRAWVQAARWLGVALRNDPAVLLQGRWRDLLLARLAR